MIEFTLLCVGTMSVLIGYEYLKNKLIEKSKVQFHNRLKIK